MRIVIKFGGTSVATPQLVRQMASKVRSLAQGNEVAVVVSAMGGTTGQLIELVKGAGSGAGDIWDVSDVVGIGEIISARIMALALKREGAKARAVTPDSEAWPVLADVMGSGRLEEEKINQEPLAVINLARTAERCVKKILPLMAERTIPVICGFLARDDRDRTVVLGRGGSDISAVMLGRCLGADRVIIVTDVPGVLRADPRMIPGRGSIRKISIGEIESLSRGGARVIHPSSLQYKLPGQSLSIVDYRSRSFLKGGTEIVGKRQARIFSTRDRLACVTVVGKDFLRTPGLLHAVTGRLARSGISIYGVSSSENTIGLYVRESLAGESYREVYAVVEANPKFLAVSAREDIGRLRLSSEAFIEQQGIIGRIGDLLAMKGINIIEMVTLQSDITIFLNYKDLHRAGSLLRQFSF